MTSSLQQAAPRLPAQPSRLGAWLVYRALVRPALRNSFWRVALDDQAAWVDGMHVMRTASPVLCYVTHTAWWDGYLAFELFRNVHPRRHFLMMEEAQLKRYFFFRWCGCFSVNRADAREGVRSIRYAAHLLRSERYPLVWLFPQGVIRPADQRPLELYRGAAEIAIRMGGGWCVPVALRYEFGPEQRPEALIRCGPPLWVDGQADAKAVHAAFTERLTATADSLQQAWSSGDLSQFRTILQGRASVNQVFDQAMRPWLTLWRRLMR